MNYTKPTIAQKRRKGQMNVNDKNNNLSSYGMTEDS